MFFPSVNLFVSENTKLNEPYSTMKVESGDAFTINENFSFKVGGARAYSIHKNNVLFASRNSLNFIKIDTNIFSYTIIVKDRVLTCHLHNKTILYGNQNGLFKVIDSTSIPFFQKELNQSTLRDIIYLPAQKSYYIGTEQGFLYKINEALDSIYKFNFQLNQIRDLSIKNKNTLLISTSNQLIEFDVNKKKIEKKIGTTEGLMSNYIIKTIYADSTYYITTNAGLSILADNEFEKTFQKYYPTYLKSIQIDNIDVELTDTIHLKSNNNYLKIEFTNLTYWNNSDIKYKYRLKELNQEWILTNSSKVEFAQFPYGNYTFQLKTVDAKNKDRTELLELHIIRSKPYWLTFWFRFIVLLFVFFVLAWFINAYYRKKVKSKINQQEKQLLKHKTALAEYKALRLQMNPHFLFNSLNAVQNSILDNDIEKANAYLNDFAILMRQILQYSTKDKIKLSEEIKLSKDYLNIEKNRYKNTINFKLIIENNIDVDSILIPPMIFQPILENAIWHGIVPLNSNGQIKLSLKLENDYLKVIILDNGIGYTNALKKPNTHKKRDSIAIKNTNDRLKYFDKSNIKKEKYITITNGLNKGTEVVLFIYIKN